jgi:hypothetical protein
MNIGVPWGDWNNLDFVKKGPREEWDGRKETYA